MQRTEEFRRGINFALEESFLCGLELDAERKIAAATFSVRTLPEAGGPPPEDSRVQIVFRPVGRLVASLRLGHWNDRNAEVVCVAVDQLTDLIQELGCQAVYGSNFLDVPHEDIDWLDRLSLDCRLGDEGMTHTITLFQEGADKHLDIRIWFDNLEVYSPTFERISLEEFVAGTRRWWEALHAGDARLRDSDIVLLKPNEPPE